MDPDLRGHRRAAVHGRCRARLLRLPEGLEVLIGFTPDDLDQPHRVRRVPLLLHPDAAGLRRRVRDPAVRRDCSTWPASSPGKALGAHRPWIIIGTFVFAAVATPSTDPFSMLILAVPMLVLFGISEVIARLVDRRRGRGRHSHRPSGTTTRPCRCDARPLVATSTRSTCPTGWATGRSTWSADAGAAAATSCPATFDRAPNRSPATCSPSTRPTPLPCLDDAIAPRAHQAWRHGQVLLLTRDEPVPPWPRRARRGQPDPVLEVFTRLARAVGVQIRLPWTAHLALS